MAVLKAGGYEHIFLEQSSKLRDFECPLCLHVTREPSLTSCCGQHFCQSCINQVTIARKPCPFCKERRFNVLLDKKQRRRVLELKVYCTMKERGCTWTGDLGDLECHTDPDVQNSGSCQYINIVCSNECGMSIQRRYLQLHLLRKCPNRHFKCEFCDFLDTYSNINNEHYPKCMKYPLYCPNECGIGKVERGMMEKHLNECPQQIVDCEFAHAGCKFKFCRKDFKRHTEQCMQSHLSIMSSKVQELGKEVEMLKTRLDEKDKETRTLKTRLDEIDKEMRRLKTRLDEKDKEMRMPKTELYQKDEKIRRHRTKPVAIEQEKKPKPKPVEYRLALGSSPTFHFSGEAKGNEEVKTRLDEKDKETRTLKTRLDEKDKEMRRLRTRLDEKEKEMRMPKTELYQKDEKIRRHRTKPVAIEQEKKPKPKPVEYRLALGSSPTFHFSGEAKGSSHTFRFGGDNL